MSHIFIVYICLQLQNKHKYCNIIYTFIICFCSFLINFTLINKYIMRAVNITNSFSWPCLRYGITRNYRSLDLFHALTHCLLLLLSDHSLAIKQICSKLKWSVAFPQPRKRKAKALAMCIISRKLVPAILLLSLLDVIQVSRTALSYKIWIP